MAQQRLLETKINPIMKTIIFFILSITLCAGASALNDGHDSLLFDGENYEVLHREFLGSNRCFFKVAHVIGTATGMIKEPKVISGCTKEFETLYVVVDKKLQKGDILIEGTTVYTDAGSGLVLNAYLPNDNPDDITGSFYIYVNENSNLIVPRLQNLCERINEQETLELKKGKVKFKSEKGKKSKVRTVGIKSSVIHTKTHYSHDVQIDGDDTIDVIRVYEGSVEVTNIGYNFSEEEAMARELEKLSIQFSENKISAEEFGTKMMELSSRVEKTRDIRKPTIVDEGNMCKVTGSSIIVEPLDSVEEKWWEE